LVSPSQVPDSSSKTAPSSYVEVLALTHPSSSPISLFKKRNYKIGISVGVQASITHPVTCVLDTGAGPNLINKDFLPPSWTDKIRPAQDPGLIAATRQAVSIEGVILLHVRVGELRVRVWFGVVSKLAVPALLGTSFIDSFIRAILPLDRKILPLHSPPVAILDSYTSSAVTLASGALDKEGREDKALAEDKETQDLDAFLSSKPTSEGDTFCPVRVARSRSIPPMTTARVLVSSSALGLHFLSTHKNLVKNRLALLAQGVMEIVPHKPFYVAVSNFGSKPIQIPKHMHIATANGTPETLIYRDPQPMDDTSARDNVVTAVHYKPSASRETQLAQHQQVQQDDADLQDKDWKKTVTIAPRYEHMRSRITDMMEEFTSMWDGNLGTISAVKHRIDLDPPDSQPVHSAPYRAGPATRQLEKNEIDKMLGMGVIEPAQTEWASPIVFAPKKDGAMRFCVDYRRLNAMTLRDSYPIPRMDECIDSLGDANIFTTLDANCGYWQIEIADQDKDKTTFTSHHGLYRFVRMPFGLRNAPSTFQRVIDIILSTVKWQYALVYLDDVIIYSRSAEEHMTHVATVLRMLMEAGVTLKLRKCSLFADKVDYLGHVIRPGKLEVSEHTTDAVRDVKEPTTVTGIRSFLGLCNVFRRFVPNFARIAAPLNAKLRKGEPVSFGPFNDKEQEAFDTLKMRLISPPVIALPRGTGKYTVDTDACDRQVGCVLLQEQLTGPDRPIGYWSRSLTSAEAAYDTTERECLAVVWAVTMLEPYLQGTRFTIRTDHEALRWILTMTDAKGKLERWRLRLSAFDYDVVHLPGVKHQAADALSRLETDTNPIDDDLPLLVVEPGSLTPSPISYEAEGPPPSIQIPEVLAVDASDPPPTTEEMILAQSEDKYCQQLTATVGTPGSIFDINRLGVLVRISKLDGAVQVVVPLSLQPKLLRLGHYSLLAGHPGSRRMYDTMRHEFYWPNMARDVYQVVLDCQSCAATQGTRHRHQKMMKLFQAKGPLEDIAMDLLGPLPRTRHGKQHVLVITDRYSKLTRTIALSKTTAPHVAQAFVDHWVMPYGIPASVLSDNGPQFVSKFMGAVCGILGVKQLTTTAYHPQTNGQTERYNKTIVARLRHYVAENQADWDEYVQPLTYAYNAQVHRSTRVPPFALVLSRNPPGPAQVIPPTAQPSDASPPLRASRLRMRLIRELAHLQAKTSDILRNAQRRYKADHDQHVKKVISLRRGDLVYLDRPPSWTLTDAERMSLEAKSKLLPRTTGPFQVIRTSQGTATLDENGIENTVSIDRVTLAPVRGSPPPEEEEEVRRDHAQETQLQVPDNDNANQGTHLPDENQAKALDSDKAHQGPHLPAVTEVVDADNQATDTSAQEQDVAISHAQGPRQIPRHDNDIDRVRPSTRSQVHKPSQGTAPHISPGTATPMSRTATSSHPGTATSPSPGTTGALNPGTAEQAPVPSLGTASQGTKNKEQDQDMETGEYAVDRIVDHERGKDGIRYQVRWYGFGPTEDTLEPAHHLPSHFITRYWKRRRRRRRTLQ